MLMLLELVTTKEVKTLKDLSIFVEKAFTLSREIMSI